jgi:photosystem II stability/assembly factor-like uncharacterized protein
MFEHLDDPADEIRPGARELAMVGQRAEQIRTRRRWTLMVGSCCVLLAASVGFFVARPAGHRPAPASTAVYQFNLLKGKLPVGLPVPTTALVDVGFSSPQDGFALAVHRGVVLLAASNDGGATWTVRNDGLAPGLGAGAGYPGQFEFIGSTGYLWGASTTSGAPLWVSHDSGATWVPAPIGPYVLDASAIGPNVWALTSTCLDSLAPAANATAPCSIGLEQSVDSGGSWTALPGPTVAINLPEGIPLRPVELARITKTSAYVLTSGATNPNQYPDWFLSYTADSGATWTSGVAPCETPFGDGAEVAASSTTDLWLLCGSQATAGEQSKQLYRSSDGGQQWSVAASATGVGTPPPSSVPPNPLPLAGYVAPFTVGHRNLAVASATTAWLFPSRADLYRTADGGRSWVPVPELATAGFASGGGGNITFLSATDGWICEYGLGLWHTTDGLHWQPLGTG